MVADSLVLRNRQLLVAANSQPTHKDKNTNCTMTANPLSELTFTTQWTRTPAGNTGLAKVAVQFSADTFVVNQTLVNRIKFSGINRHLRQAAWASQ